MKPIESIKKDSTFFTYILSLYEKIINEEKLVINKA